MTQPARSERGQAFAVMILALVALLGTAALTMDVGFAWYAKRQVQASADAAALAGAQQLPDISSATTTANTYATLNTPDNLSNVVVKVTTRCSANAGTWCGPTSAYQANTIAVTESAKTPTWFANVLGFNHFDVSAVSTACQPCSSAPVDIMVVIDRTGSMCQSLDSRGNNVQNTGGCTDLNNAKDGVRALLGIMDPSIDTVGLVAFPPYDSTGGICGSAAQGNMNVIAGANSLSKSASQVDSGWYDSTALTYLDDPLASTFRTSSAATTLNPSSTIVQHTVKDVSSDNQNCIDSFGSTS
jgi:Putative Flp pilus-assembly TadE/G-like